MWENSLKFSFGAWNCCTKHQTYAFKLVYKVVLYAEVKFINNLLRFACKRTFEWTSTRFLSVQLNVSRVRSKILHFNTISTKCKLLKIWNIKAKLLAIISTEHNEKSQCFGFSILKTWLNLSEFLSFEQWKTIE